MGRDNSIKKFFSNMSCSQCSDSFTEESINIMREEDNYSVVKVCCDNCGKNFGIAILGLDRDDMAKCFENPNDESCKCNPINYNDVLDAHKFFKSLDSDWMNHVPKDKISE